MNATIGEKVPNLGVSTWVQGAPTNLDQERDRIVLVEVFQVNCPGCFMHALPSAINIYNKYRDDGVRVLGLATAFEDFDKNTLENLKLLVETGSVIGETYNALSVNGQLNGDKLSYKIPFPLGMDNLIKNQNEPTTDEITKLILPQIPDFDSQPKEYQDQIRARVRDYLMSKEYNAETFERFALRGTPSSILVDRQGILRDVSFGQMNHIEPLIKKILDED